MKKKKRFQVSAGATLRKYQGKLLESSECCWKKALWVYECFFVWRRRGWKFYALSVEKAQHEQGCEFAVVFVVVSGNVFPSFSSFSLSLPDVCESPSVNFALFAKENAQFYKLVVGNSWKLGRIAKCFEMARNDVKFFESRTFNGNSSTQR